MPDFAKKSYVCRTKFTKVISIIRIKIDISISLTGKAGEEKMPRVVVNCQNYMFSDMIRRTLRTGDFHVTVVDDPADVIGEFNNTAANIVLLEVTGSGPWTFSRRMELRKIIQRVDPDCKIVFMVDEKAEPEIADKIKQAKIDGLIDQFIYSSISAGYLKAVMETTV